GNEKSLTQIIKKQKIDAVFVVREDLSKEEILKNYLPYSQKMNIELKIISQVFNVLSFALELSEFDGIPLMGFKEMKQNRLQRMAKRASDIVLSATALFLAAPVMLLLIPLIKLTSPGPIFYKQTRVTRGGKHF